MTRHTLPHMLPDELRARITDVFEQRGMRQADAADMARALVRTSMRGVDTHGIRLLPTYLRELEGGRARARPSLEIRCMRPAVATLDADGAPGVLAGLHAARCAAEMASAHGVGWVAVRGSNHFGAASVYTLEICDRGLVGLAFSNADALMSPSPAQAPALGTNPISIAFPTEGAPFCLDMATSQVSWSRIKARWAAGGPLPPGWALDASGVDCAEPGAGPPVMACPLGGYKGAALALAIELLCAGLAGARFGYEQSHLYGAPWDTPRDVAHAVMAIDPGALDRGGALRRRASTLLSWYRMRPRGGTAPLTTPGDLEAESCRRRRAGVPIEPAVAAALKGSRGDRSAVTAIEPAPPHVSQADALHPSSRKRMIGILGGLGPHAHIEFERCLLRAVPGARNASDYPAWFLSSSPLDLSDIRGSTRKSLLDALLAGLSRLAPAADFAVIPCNTAHMLIDDLRCRSPLPLVDMIEATVRAVVAEAGERAVVGLLATSDVLRAGLYPTVAGRIAPDLEWIDLLGLPDGDALQEALVMRPLRGPVTSSGARGAARDPETGLPRADALREAVERLQRQGAHCIVLGCTELPLTLGRGPIEGCTLIDPLAALAAEAVEIAFGRRPLPGEAATAPKPSTTGRHS